MLERQSQQVRAFLLQTSVLERLSGSLCDAVTGRTDSQALLGQVERANLFLMPLDEVRGWWRYHHLFADLLRARLQEEQPGQAAQLHRNAAAWHEEHGLADEAIRHALAAVDPVWAARLIERHFDALFFRRGEGATVQRWLAAIPAEIASSRPRLLLARSRMALAGGRVEAAGQLLDAAERAQAGAAGVEGEPSVPSAGRGSWLVNVPAAVTTQRAYLAALRGDAEEAAAFASQALAVIGDDEWMLASHARGYLSLAEWMRARLTEAEQMLSSITAQWRVAGERALAVRGCHHLGQIQRAGGRLDAALGTYQQAVDIAAGPGRPHLPVAGTGYVGLAEVAYQQGELDAAAELATIGAGYAGKSLIRLAIRAGHQVAFAHAAELWHAERRLHLTVEPCRCGRCWPGVHLHDGGLGPAAGRGRGGGRRRTPVAGLRGRGAGRGRGRAVRRGTLRRGAQPLAEPASSALARNRPAGCGHGRGVMPAPGMPPGRWGAGMHLHGAARRRGRAGRVFRAGRAAGSLAGRAVRLRRRAAGRLVPLPGGLGGVEGGVLGALTLTGTPAAAAAAAVIAYRVTGYWAVGATGAAVAAGLARRRPPGPLHPDPRHGSARAAAAEDSTPKPTFE